MASQLSESSQDDAIAAFIALNELNSPENRTTRNRGQWVRQFVSDRKAHGAYHCLINVLKADQKGYKNFFRMDFPTFEELLDKVSPLIAKQDTVMREAIPSEERLAITLRFLATGMP